METLNSGRSPKIQNDIILCQSNAFYDDLYVYKHYIMILSEHFFHSLLHP